MRPARRLRHRGGQDQGRIEEALELKSVHRETLGARETNLGSHRKRVDPEKVARVVNMIGRAVIAQGLRGEPAERGIGMVSVAMASVALAVVIGLENALLVERVVNPPAANVVSGGAMTALLIREDLEIFARDAMIVPPVEVIVGLRGLAGHGAGIVESTASAAVIGSEIAHRVNRGAKRAPRIVVSGAVVSEESAGRLEVTGLNAIQDQELDVVRALREGPGMDEVFLDRSREATAFLAEGVGLSRLSCHPISQH